MGMEMGAKWIKYLANEQVFVLFSKNKENTERSLAYSCLLSPQKGLLYQTTGLIGATINETKN